jgi:hypothetical protein
MSNRGAIHAGLELGLAKLYMLKDSCESIYKTGDFNPSRKWFKGTAIICHEIIDRIEDALSELDEAGRHEEKKISGTAGKEQEETSI